MDGLRKFIVVDNHDSVKVGDLHRATKSKKVVKRRFTTDFPGAVIRGGRMISLCEHLKKVSHFHRHPERWKSKEWSRRQLTRTGTPSARPFFKKSKDRTGSAQKMEDTVQPVFWVGFRFICHGGRRPRCGLDAFVTGGTQHVYERGKWAVVYR